MTQVTPGDEASATIHVLGPVEIQDRDGEIVHVATAVRDVIALLVAAGTDGLTKDALAQELWATDRPSSWKSAIRNRIARAREALGPDAIENMLNRYRLSDHVRVDSSGLFNDHVDVAELSTTLDWLHGEPLQGSTSCPLIESYRKDVMSARVVCIRAIVEDGSIPLKPQLLEVLRRFQFEYPDDAVVTSSVVQAHVRAGDIAVARAIVDKSRAAGADVNTAWVDEIGDGLQRESTVVPSNPLARPAVVDRAQLFWSAAGSGDWTRAYEIAIEGTYQLATIGGGTNAWWPLLMAIPLNELDRTRRTHLASMLAWQMRVADPESARTWSKLATEQSSSNDETFLADVTAAFIGEVNDERALLPLPDALMDPTKVPSDLRAYQVVVANHLERADAAHVAPLVERFLRLFEESPDPYRQWHALNIKSMTGFVDGDWAAHTQHAKRACEYAGFYRIPEADTGWSCHLLVRDWVRQRRPAAQLGERFIAEDQTAIGQGLAAVASGDPGIVEGFLKDFALESRMTFVVPLLVALAPSVRDATLRSRLYERLQARTGTTAIFAAGLMHLGPVDRVCAQLTESPGAKLAHLESAIDVADRQQTRVWQVICRRELMELDARPAMADEIRDLANSATLCELAGLPD